MVTPERVSSKFEFPALIRCGTFELCVAGVYVAGLKSLQLILCLSNSLMGGQKWCEIHIPCHQLYA